MKNNKLYNEHYPIETEEQKRVFLENNRIALIKFIENNLHQYEGMYYQLCNKYFSQYKEEISLLGNVKYKNIKHNRIVALQMQTDHDFEKLEQRIQTSKELLYAMSMYEDISIDNVNVILESMNHIHRRNCFHTIALLVTVILLLLLSFFT